MKSCRKAQDKHLASSLVPHKARAGLAWAQYLGDDAPRLTAALGRSFASGDVVFSFGGIGATPDDHTRQCAAAAARAPLQLHPDASGRSVRASAATPLAAAEMANSPKARGSFPIR